MELKDREEFVILKNNQQKRRDIGHGAIQPHRGGVLRRHARRYGLLPSDSGIVRTGSRASRRAHFRRFPPEYERGKHDRSSAAWRTHPLERSARAPQKRTAFFHAPSLRRGSATAHRFAAVRSERNRSSI